MEILHFAIVMPLLAWVIISPAVFVWWFFDPHARYRFSESHDKIAMAIYIGAFVSFMLILAQGIKKLLFFIPGDWGGYGEGGEFVSIRSSIAGALTFFLSLFFVYVFNKFEKLRGENKRLNIIIDEVEFLDPLRKKREKVETKLNDLREKSYESQVYSENKSEIQILEKMLEELNYRIEEIEQQVEPDNL